MADTPSRVERVLNLLTLLLDTRLPLAREEIVREVAGYPPQTSANRRAFERDKETLRAMGVPLTIEPIGETGEVGYRVRPDAYYLPDLGLTDEETAALRVAVSAIWLGNRSGEGALMKLGGELPGATAPIASLPLVPALATLFDAFRHRAVVRFHYRGAPRTVEPWGMSSKRGHWYVVGWDRDREAIRSFRADRIEGDVEVGEPATFTVPEDFAPDEHIEDRPWLLGDGEPIVARVLVDAGHAPGAIAELRGHASVAARPDGAVELELPVANRAAFRAFVLGFLDHAEVLEPPVLRAEIVDWLERSAQ